ncbi:MAG: Gfo/Idh/MocA family oxidoreductase [Bacteroidales bacterium]|nr:Gfo/Idh/MocA family oxidoreductase [Bacteroidales bacterium]
MGGKTNIKFGVIGTGKITGQVLEGAALDARFELAAVYSRSMEGAKIFAGKYGVSGVFTDFEAMSACIDAVYIASPNALHKEQAMYFLKKGIHVLCEKPLCSNAYEARQLIEASQKYRAVFMEAMVATLNPNFLALINHLPKIGTLRKYFASFCQYSSKYDRFKQGIIENTFKNELSNGALVDIGVYTIYPMVVLFGKPKSVQASGFILPSGVDGAGSAIFGYDGMDAVVSYSKVSNSSAFAEIQGEEGSLILDRINIPRQLFFKPRNGAQQDLSAAHCGNDYYYEIREFINLIETQTMEHKVNSHEHSLTVMELMDEIRRQIGLEYPADKMYAGNLF